MNKDKKIMYFISVLLFAALLTLLFVGEGNSKVATAYLLVPSAVIIFLAIKKRGILSINKKEVLTLSAIFGVLYVAFLQISGLFFKFFPNPYYEDEASLMGSVVPLLFIIVASEVIRYVLLAQKNTFVNIMTYFISLAIEALMYANVKDIISFNRFMDLMGLTLLPAIMSTIYYNYVSKNFGMFPNIVYRLITTLYIYFIPIRSGISDALSSCIKIVVPIILLFFVSALYEKKKKDAVKKGGRASVAVTVVMIVFIVAVTMLVSCQFRFGALVIATESMTGEINKGDVIIYERYDDQIIKEGQVIVFESDGVRVVHRVASIDYVSGEKRYYTKGDANENYDYGYRTDADIVGLTDVKIAFIGYPTLWLRELISN